MDEHLLLTCRYAHDTRRLLAGLKCFVPRLKKIWADAAYHGQDLADWCTAEGGWELEMVSLSGSSTRGQSKAERGRGHRRQENSSAPGPYQEDGVCYHE
jgi:hypothetical protein